MARLGRRGAFLLLTVALLPVPATAGAEGGAICALLTDGDLLATQGSGLTARVASQQPGPQFQLSQCYFRAADPGRSVSLARAVPVEGRPAGARDFWRHSFHGPELAAMQAGTRKQAPPQAVPHVGDEAFWVGDAFGGSLYVLADSTFLRVSVGGGERVDRMARARALALRVLSRIEAETRRSAEP